jgi:hypothetical protein
MTLRQRIAERAEFVAGLMELAMFIARTPELDESLAFAVPELTFPVRSKAEADEVIEAYGACPFWRNGQYMAAWNPALAEWSSGAPPELPSWLRSQAPPGFGDQPWDCVTFEMHFAPPITQERDANVRSTDVEG